MSRLSIAGQQSGGDQQEVGQGEGCARVTDGRFCELRWLHYSDQRLWALKLSVLSLLLLLPQMPEFSLVVS